MKVNLSNLSYSIPSLIIAMPDLLSAEMIAERNSICNFQIKAIINDGFEVINKIQSLKPDFLFIDSELNNFNCSELTKKIKSLNLCTKVVIYTNKGLYDCFNEFLDSSNQTIKGFVHKGIGLKELDLCFKEVFSGKKYMSSNINSYLNQLHNASLSNTISNQKLLLLANREKSVWNLMSQGKTEKEIGELLFIGLATVKTYKKRIREKLDLSGKGKLTYLALCNNMI
jgi:DNA-binding NarL/FixJ family response regulator